MKTLQYSLILLPFVMLLVACGATSSVKQSAAPLDYAAFIERLRGDGATVELGGDASAYPLVTPSGHAVFLNGERVSIFEYASVHEAQSEAAHISPDGASRAVRDAAGSGAGVVMDFVSAPHWYLAGRLIVLYVGTNSEVIAFLERELGAPFAGQRES